MFKKALFVIAVVVASVAMASKFIPKKFPLYKQCDPTWGDDFMNGTRPDHDTICATGCAMSSVAMALAGHNLRMPGTGELIDPQNFNHWLQKNNGYWCDGDFCNNLVLDAPDRLFPGHVQFISEKEKPDVDTMVEAVRNENPQMIIHVNNNHHFVLVIGVELPAVGNDTQFYVHDPGSGINFTRSYSEISDIILYTMKD